ncbi:MAG: DUF4251 domain-containing protein [Bacteroidota bacterium]|nr:DUF4251 domain-containing protein [Bacteroidota bacterium]
MKTLIKPTLVLAFVAMFATVANAQKTAKDKKAARVATITKIVTDKNYVFEANYVIPQRGNSRSLSYGYDVVVSKDTIVAYLPYFGRVTLAPSDPSDGGVKFTSTNFSYVEKPGKKGGFDITITPKENNMQGSKDVRYLRLNISENGYASLQVFSNNRDPISFNGTIEERKHHK